MTSTLKIAKRLCRYVTEKRISCQLLLSEFKESPNFRPYHHYSYLLREYQGQTVTTQDKNLLLWLPAPRTVDRYFSSANVDELIVKHDPDEGRFYIDIAGIGSAYIEYERRDELMIIKHTDVPSELGGQGIGKILAKEALEFVAKNDLQLEIQCSFVRKYVSKYEPKYIKYIIQK